jgi:NitT/TauT family transport system substrate-binding protein
MKRIIFLFALPIILLAGMYGLYKQPFSRSEHSPDSQIPSDTSEEQANPLVEKKPMISVGLIPTCDSFLILQAIQSGYFAQEGIDAQYTLFQSASERDAAYISGTINAMAADYCTTSLSAKTDNPLLSIALTIGSDLESGKIGILSSPSWKPASLDEIKGFSLGISRYTIIEYLTDQLLLDAGIHPSEVEFVQVNKISMRLNMLLSDQIPLAVLPEPMLSFAIAKGAHLIRDSTYGVHCHAILGASQSLLSQHPDLPEKIRSALKKTAININSNPQDYRTQLIEHARIPKETASQFLVPHYPEENFPDPHYFQKVLHWCVRKEYLSPDYLSFEGIK